MKYLRWIGLMPSLLIAALAGELFSPLPSESAAPTTRPVITLQMDGGTLVTINTALGTCLSGDTTLAYNYCYTFPAGAIVTGTGGKQYKVVANGTPRVRLSDKNGMDKLSLTGVNFVPVTIWPNTEPHKLVITLSATMDATTDGLNGATINETNAQSYPIALRSSGAFIPNAGSTAAGNKVTLEGRATLRVDFQNAPTVATAGTVNRNPPTFTATTTDANWGGTSNTDMGYIITFPSFNCTKNYGTPQAPLACRATLTQKLTVDVIGPDSINVLAGPLDQFMVACNETFSANNPDQVKQIQYLKSVINGLTFIFPQIQNPEAKDRITRLLNYLKAALALTTAPPPADQPNCPGQNVLAFNLALEVAADAAALKNGIPQDRTPPHSYAVINAPGITWERARERAQEIRSDCQLATITSAAEQAIIEGLLPDPNNLDGTREYWIGGKQGSYACEPGCNWQWINEEGTFWNSGPVADMFANWAVEEPDNNYGQNHLGITSNDGWRWTDLQGASENRNGYITEGLSGVCVPAGDEDED